jgi:hypothetical protein
LLEDGNLLNTIDEWCQYTELKAVHEAITGYEDAIMREEPGAKEAFDAYKARRKASVDPINEVLSLDVSDAFGADVIH